MSPNLISWESVEEETLQPGITRKVVHGVNITVAQIGLKEGSVVPSHAHHNEQISSVIRGAIKVETDTEEFTVEAGNLITLPPNIPHKVTALKDSLVLDTFSPPRKDWQEGNDSYLRR